MCGGVCLNADQDCGDGSDSIPGPYIPGSECEEN